MFDLIGFHHFRHYMVFSSPALLGACNWYAMSWLSVSFLWFTGTSSSGNARFIEIDSDLYH